MAATERLVNFYLEKNETPNAASPYCLLNTPGFTTICTVPEGPIRALFTTDTQQFFVAGFRFYELGAGDVPIARGTLAADAHPATIAWNGPNGGATLYHLRGCRLLLRPHDAHAHDGPGIMGVNAGVSRRVLPVAECVPRLDADFQLV